MEDEMNKMTEETLQQNMPRTYKKNGGIIALIVAVFILGLAGGLAFMYVGAPYIGIPSSSNAPINGTQPTQDQTTPTDANDAQTLNVTWLSAPEKLGDLKLLIPSGNSNFDPSSIAYYKIGTVGSSDIIIGTPGSLGPGYTTYVTFIKRGNEYQVLAKYSTDASVTDYATVNTVPGVLHDTTTKIENGFDIPASITYKGVSLSTNVSIGSRPLGDLNIEDPFGNASYIKKTTLAQLPEGLLVSVSRDETEGQYKNESLYLNLPSFTTANYDIPIAFLKDDSVALITWNDGSKNTDGYRSDGVGSCAFGGRKAVLDTMPKDSEITAVGTADTGEIIYAFKDLDNPTLNYFYNLSSAKAGDGGTPALSKRQYNDAHGLIFYKDKLDRAVVLSSLKYGPLAECGKPVIYLYPAQTMPVSVQVGAQITKSEPVYNDGWNVIAHPDGTLTDKDSTYPYLYWDGYGKEYPMITHGTVVARADVEKTLNTQMTQLGLTAKEQTDFLEFWMPHMPDTPYVRLSWLGTQAMNRLAPLAISPEPDTLIRVFLDFKGLQIMENIKPQQLFSQERKGFTVVEWGGLLKNQK